MGTADDIFIERITATKFTNCYSEWCIANVCPSSVVQSPLPLATYFIYINVSTKMCSLVVCQEHLPFLLQERIEGIFLQIGSFLPNFFFVLSRVV